ncbi:hypothetical protein GW793_00710 [bacterium]|nr:hypothetical protein [bacterium]
MFKLYGILLLSFTFTSALAVPFIGFLYRLKFKNNVSDNDANPPVGGDLLIIIATILFSLIYYALTSYTINWTSIILFVSLLGFGALGFYDDFQKIFHHKKRGFIMLTIWQKLILQIIGGLVIGYLLYTYMGLSTVWLPVLTPVWGVAAIELGALYIPFAVLVIIIMSNAFKATNGTDGLATGLMLIALSAYWYLAQPFLQAYGDIHLFIAVLMGSLFAFLYFNIFPARLRMGDTGSQAFGALLAVIALMINQVMLLPIIAGVFVAELISILIQKASMRLRGKKVFRAIPLHSHFESKGWDPTKVTMRFWLVGVTLVFVGLLFASVPT